MGRRFSTEEAAKAARVEARVKARERQYIDHNSITVATYLDQWIDAHAVQAKHKTLQDYRHLIDRHIRPRIGDVRLQALRPATITKLYRNLAASGGRNGAGLSPRTVEYVHAVLRKAFRDAVVVDQLLPSNPVERAKRPRKPLSKPGQVWPPGQLRAFLDATSTGCSPSAISLHTPAPAVASCSTFGGATSTWISERSVSRLGCRHRRTTYRGNDQERSGPAPSASTPRLCRCSGIIASGRPRSA